MRRWVPSKRTLWALILKSAKIMPYEKHSVNSLPLLADDVSNCIKLISFLTSYYPDDAWIMIRKKVLSLIFGLTQFNRKELVTDIGFYWTWFSKGKKIKIHSAYYDLCNLLHKYWLYIGNISNKKTITAEILDVQLSFFQNGPLF